MIKIKSTNNVYFYEENLCFILNGELKVEYSEYLKILFSFEKIKCENISNNYNFFQIKMHQAIEKCHRLSLEVTEKCNFRCKYCAYSGNYSAAREHSNNSMSFDIAKKAIDLFLDLKSKDKQNGNDLFVDFYGGEPLIEFELIKRIISYFSTFQEYTFRYSMTTNGSLISGTVWDFFIENNFVISISLDGPQEEHDRFRVFRNGRGTFDVIKSNIEQIIKKKPEFFFSNVKFICTLHCDHNGKKIADFFKNSIFTKGKTDRIRFNTVNTIMLKKKSGKKYSFETYKIFSEKIQSRFFKNRLEYVRPFGGIEAITGACFPGEIKLYVTRDGKIHMCEKMTSHHDIGDIYTGLNLSKIKRIVDSWHEQKVKLHCFDCCYKLLCDVCYIQGAYEDGIEINCNKSGYKKMLEAFVNEVEKKSTDFGVYLDSDFHGFMQNK